MNNATEIKFNTGQNYATTSICDSDCIFDFTIIRRTAKSVWVEVNGEVVRRAIFSYGNAEQFSPFGSYSMSATISADDPTADAQRAKRGW